jgi:hypothetical protein
MPSATGEFEVKSWQKNTYQELEGEGKLTRASVTETFSGGITGSSEVEWLMCHRDDGSARFVGIQRIEGAVHGRNGSFVVESNGDFDGSQATGTWSVLPGSGTQDLADLRGEGGFQAPLGRTDSSTLEYRSKL